MLNLHTTMPRHKLPIIALDTKITIEPGGEFHIAGRRYRTPADVAYRSGLTRDSVIRLVHDGRVRGVRLEVLPLGILVDMGDFEKYENTHLPRKPRSRAVDQSDDE
ncbi:MAG: hypothetical protein WCF84_09275 [Anaerolineae bacterium]